MGIEAISNYTVYETAYNKETQQPKETQLPATELQTENAVQSEDDGVIVDIVDIQNAGNTQVEDNQNIGKAEFNYKANSLVWVYNSLSTGQTLDEIGYTATMYAYTKFQLQKNYTGDDLTQQLADFDQYFSDILDEYFTPIYKDVDRLNKYGEVISDDTINDISQSYRDLTYQLGEQYLAYIDTNFDSNDFNPKNTPEIVRTVRSSYIASGQATKLVSDSGYTMEDLAAIRLFTNQIDDNYYELRITYGMSAEENGMRLGLLTAKVNYIADHVATSKDTRVMIRSMMTEITSNVVNKAVTWYANDAYTDKSYKLDEAAFWDKLNETQAAYQSNDRGVSLKNVYSDAAQKYFSGKQITKNSYYVDEWQKLTDALTVGWNDFIDKMTSRNGTSYYIDPSKFSINVCV